MGFKCRLGRRLPTALHPRDITVPPLLSLAQVDRSHDYISQSYHQLRILPLIRLRISSHYLHSFTFCFQLVTMVIIDEKAPPPPYFAQVLPVVPDHRNRTAPKLSSLPASLLLQIVYYTFPSGPHPAIQTFDDDRQDRINMTLDWIEMSLRKVNRGFYTGQQHRILGKLILTCMYRP